MLQKRGFILLLFILLTATLLRYVPLIKCWTDGPKVVADDPPYHLRRAKLIIKDPQIAFGKDPFVDFPDGAKPCWPYGFDGMLAGISILSCGHSPSMDCMAKYTSLFIPILALFILIVAYFMFLRVTSDHNRALLMLGLFAVFWPFLEYSFACRVDHHLMAPLFVISLVLFSVMKKPFLAGITAGSGQIFTPVSFVSTLPIASIFILVKVYNNPKEGTKFATNLLLGFTIGFILSLLTSPFPMSFVYYSPSLFHVLPTFAAMMAASVFHYLLTTGPDTPAKKSFFRYIAITVVFVGAVTGLIKPLHDSIAKALYLSGSNTMKIALEFNSYFHSFTVHALTGVILILLTVLTLVHSLKTKGQTSIILGISSLIAWLMTIQQRRWATHFSPLLIWAGVQGLFILADILQKWARQTLTISLGAVIIAMSGIGPFLKMNPLTPYNQLAYKIAFYIKKHTPEVNPHQPQYGILTPWSMGHVIQAYADRPVICDNFFGIKVHDNALKRCDLAYLATNVDNIFQILRSLRVRYIVVVPPHPYQVAAQMRRIGMNPELFINKSNHFTVNFMKTLTVRLGLFNGKQARLPDGEVLKPLKGIKLIHRFYIKRGEKIAAQASLFLFNP